MEATKKITKLLKSFGIEKDAKKINEIIEKEKTNEKKGSTRNEFIKEAISLIAINENSESELPIQNPEVLWNKIGSKHFKEKYPMELMSIAEINFDNLYTIN